MKTRLTNPATLATCLLALLTAGSAHATEGYFLGGYGATQTGLAGAGVAHSTDAMSISLNPAGLADLQRQFNGAISLFGPTRGYTATGPGFVAPGTVKSGEPLFAIPNFAYSSPIDAASGWGIAVYGNGGLNTEYANIANPACGPSSGIFCGGKAGVNLSQAFVTAGYGRKFGTVSLGIAPIIGVQAFRASGLAAFSPGSANPAALTNRGNDFAFGAGVRIGAQWSVTSALRLALAGATPIYMTKFSKYAGLFANQGSFDVPGNVTAGFAFDVMPSLTLMADYKRIFYSGVSAVANPTTNAAPFGSNGGPGFGWTDVDVVAFGAEWRTSPDLTLRVGYEHNTNPVRSRDVTLNILAPGVTTDQFSAGLSYKVSANSTLDLAGYYVPTHTVSGIEMTPRGPNPGRTIALRLSEISGTIGYTYHFGGDPAKADLPLVARY